MTRINLSTKHAISIFLNNLKPELNNAVKVENPSSLPQAYYLARLQEANFAVQSKAIKGSSATHLVFRGAPNQWTSEVVKENAARFKMHVTATFDNNRRRRLQLKWVRKELKACVCDDPFTPGHKCKAKR